MTYYKQCRHFAQTSSESSLRQRIRRLQSQTDIDYSNYKRLLKNKLSDSFVDCQLSDLDNRLTVSSKALNILKTIYSHRFNGKL